MSGSNADVNLLFGILALQMDFINRDQLVGAMHAWALEKSSTLGEILVREGSLTEACRNLIHSLVQEHVKRHDDSPQRSLAAISSVDLAPEQLKGIQDEEIVASLSLVPSVRSDEDPERTELVSMGTATPTGQRFRMLRPHARGGLGQVSVALDEELHREVALKELLAKHADRPENRARFVMEAEINGGLEHPGIVPVYGFGQYASGRPFYAMRFIRGESLRKAIDRFHSDRARSEDRSKRAVAFLKLIGRFVDVCNAVEYAHSRGVLHRDLKPDNIMLGKYGETLVVDWGLAKTYKTSKATTDLDAPPLHPHSSTIDSTMTHVGAVIGTPAYMSPEQAAGRLDLLGPASDVYSLGCTLYHLVTGKTPFADGDLPTVLENVQRGDFLPPREVNKTVPAPLSAICLRAMQQRPEERYESSAALAEDLTRWAADEPVSAWKEPLLLRAARWTRHHRSLVSGSLAALLVTLATLSVGVVMLSQARERERTLRIAAVESFEEAERQRTRAEKNFAQAEEAFQLARAAVDRYFTQVSENTLLNEPGMQPLRRELLQNALEYYQQFITQRSDDATIRDELADTYFRVGVISESLESPETSLASYRQAREIQQELVAAAPNHPQTLYALGNTVNATGRALQRMQQFDEALQAYQEASAIRKQLVDLVPTEPEYHRTLANSYMNLGLVHSRLGNSVEAQRRLQQSQEIRRRQLQQRDDPKIRRDLAKAYFNLAALSLADGEHDAGRRYLQEAAKAFELVLAGAPQELTTEFELARCYRLLGDQQAMKSEWTAALQWYEKARGHIEALSYRNPDVPDYRAALARVHMDAGQVNTAREKPAEAAASLEQARQLLEPLLNEYENHPPFQRDLAVTLREIARLQLASDATDEARPNLQRSQELLQQLWKRYSDDPDYERQLSETEALLETLPANESGSDN